MPFEIPDNWRWTRLSFISTNISDKQFQIKQSEILQDGIYPVVSQSQNLIEGYCNDKNKLLSHKKPFLVFGDHSKTLKYVDFDFVVGADDTKILESFVDAKFLYYHLLRNICNLPTKSYGRHFTLLSDIAIALPPLEEQNRIVAKLEQILPLIADLS